MSLIPFRSRKKKKKRPSFSQRKAAARSVARTPGRHKPAAQSRLKRVLKQLFWRFFWLGAAVVGLGALYFSYDLPDIEDLNKFSKTPSILVKAENGDIVGSFGDIYGDYVPFEELPRSLIDAVVATEDRNYFYHLGIDPWGLLRASIANLRAGYVVQGGSTITQQVAKNVFLTPERSLTRKIREMFLAVKLERRFSKEDIMSIYLNRVYLGAGNFGVDAAAKRYFDKTARDLNLGESAIMAGLLKAPSRFAPTSNPTLSRQRAEQVLVNMEDAGFLDAAQTKKAREDLVAAMSKRKPNSRSTLYFADWIMEQLPEYIGNVQQDLVVTTTLQPERQVAAERAMSEIMDRDSEKYAARQAALVSMTPDGAIRAMIGGRSYAESQFNRATQSLRQPGSSFKLFVYLAGLESGLTPDTLVEDQPIVIETGQGKWEPKNYTGKYLGTLPLRDAVAQSINTVAVQVSQQAGLDRVIDVARRLGLTADLQPLHSIALGAVEVSLIEMTTAYAHLAAGGDIVYPYGITKIDTNQGENLYQREYSGTASVVRPDIVGMMNDMLQGVVREGTARGAAIGRPAAGKTGTTSDYRDAWFMGYTPDLVTGVWVGNDDNSPMKKVTGGMLPAQIWKGYMFAALANTPARAIQTGSQVLPWKANTLSTRPQKQKPRPAPGELTPSFWEKLLGEETQQDIKYQYPGK